mmetsp:Transcript_23748/g.51890  ORF Transcript_23748/g.51890 Transcript_23748/m.51890 type:complete len:86 (-) Transcript_23748:33-290(-)
MAYTPLHAAGRLMRVGLADESGEEQLAFKEQAAGDEMVPHSVEECLRHVAYCCIFVVLMCLLFFCSTQGSKGKCQRASFAWRGQD